MSPLSHEDILKLSRNFMESRILLSAAELDLFTVIGSQALTAKEIAKKTGADVRALTILLDALAAMDILVKESGEYRCAAAFLSANVPDSILPMVLHAAHLWRRWSGLTETVRGSADGGPAGPARSEAEMRAFIGAMHVVAAPLAREIVAAVNPGTARFLIDVGGASGTYTAAFLAAYPRMEATLFDRPGVIEMARERLGKEGLLHRVVLVAGDFYRDELPRGHDLAFVSAIIHQNSLEENRELFRKVFRCLVSRGRIVIRDHVMEPDRVHPKDGAIFAVNMLMGTEGGRTYTFEEIREGLAGAGFTGIGLLRKGAHMDALVEAFRP